MIYFISTKHDRYSKYLFEEGAIVIDPWRYVPDQRGVTVKRIGENKPELISLLVPTRGRPTEHVRMVKSALELATHPRYVEIITYLDIDDATRYSPRMLGVTYIVGPQILLSETWNECYRSSRGEILMHAGDDIVFKTPGWDALVRAKFREYPDRIVLVHGDDVSPNTDALATHGFLHRKWVETVGYFLPPLFSSDWNDVWLTEVADALGRRLKVPIVTEHMHYQFGKAEHDETYREREERGDRDRVKEIYLRTAAERSEDAEKLRAVMACA